MPPATAPECSKHASAVSCNAFYDWRLAVLPFGNHPVLCEIIPTGADASNARARGIGTVEQCREPSGLRQIVSMHDEIPINGLRQPRNAFIHILVFAAIFFC